MPLETEVKISGLNELSPDLQEVIADLDGLMPPRSSVIVQIINTGMLPDGLSTLLRNTHAVSKILQQSLKLHGLLPSKIPSGRRPVYTSPNTWLVGAFDPGKTDASEYGLFSRLDGIYYPDYVKRALGVETSARVNHRGLDVEQLTGRTPGAVSLVLERRYLEGCFVIDLDPRLVGDLRTSDRMVDYPLGNERFYCARGEAFLNGYAEFLKTLGVHSNLQSVLGP